MSSLGIISRFRKLVILCSFAGFIGACASSGPATRYYSLFSTAEPVEHATQTVSFGIGPIVLPEYLENPSIVVRTNGQRVRVLGYDAWAGDFKDAIARVLADDISKLSGQEAVWAFPWDNRVRPNYQVRIVFDELAGVRGGEVNLSVKWTLLNQRGDKQIAMGVVRMNDSTTGDSTEAYVASLNRLLSRLSEKLFIEIDSELAK